MSILAKESRISAEMLHDIIRAAEARHGFRLVIEDFDFLTEAVQKFIHSSIDKFIAGAKEHFDDSKDFASSVDHTRELSVEVIDSWFYVQGLVSRQKQH